MIREVLLVGNNPRLLSTRAGIVESSGVKAIHCTPNELATTDLSRFILAILCHSLTPEQTTAVVQRIHEFSPGTRVVKIRSLYNPLNPVHSQSIDELEPWPEEIVKYVSGLLANEPDGGTDSRLSA